MGFLWKGWRGVTPTVEVSNLRSRNISICSVYSKTEMVHFEVSLTPYNTEKFICFLNSFFTILRNINERNAIIILDNVAFHRTRSVRELFSEEEHIYQNFPPYSPLSNPIENSFAKRKNYVRRIAPNNETELIDHIYSGWEEITESGCEGFWGNMLTYFRECFDEEEIRD